jgi:hypothetical protein
LKCGYISKIKGERLCLSLDVSPQVCLQLGVSKSATHLNAYPII